MKKTCRDLLSSKIAINMREYKKGVYKSPKQAIAVAYAQISKKSPACKRFISRKRTAKSKTNKKSNKKSKTKTKKE